MIILRSERGEIYNLFTRSKHIIGRNGNLELEDDKSVSRQHAAIFVTVKNKKITIKLQDLGAKYGTFVIKGREIKLEKNAIVLLNIGDGVKFGLQWNTWVVEKSQYVVCASVLPTAEKQALTEILKRMKGILVSDWSDVVSHLTMDEITVTRKVIQALGRVKPIVSLEYWTVLEDVLKSVAEEPLPNCDDYVPPLNEPTLANTIVDLSMNNARRKLFKDMKFVACTTSQYNKISIMVTPSGGTVVDGTRTAFQADDFKDGNVIVLESDTFNKRNPKLIQTFKFLAQHNQRRIPESEIGMSLILVSKDTHCNPNRESEFVSRQPESQVSIKEEEEEDEGSILDLETQDDVDEDTNTQYDDDLDSSKISLAICDNEDDDLVVIRDTPEDDQPVTRRSSAKRKRSENAEPSTSKSIKMTDWVVRKPSKKVDLPSQAPSRVVENKKKPVNNLFAFNRETKPVEKSSNSLFKTSSLRTSSSSSTDSKAPSVELASESLAAAGLFKTPRSSSSTDNVEKRKRASVELASESPAPPAKKANVVKKDLFQLPSTSKTTRTGSLILFDSDSVDSPPQRVSKVKPDEVASDKENSPVEMPKSVIQSKLKNSAENEVKLKNSAKKEVKEEIKEESDDMSFDTKSSINQSIILTMPLVKSSTQERQSLNTSNGSAVNFKKFRKNNGINRTCVIPTNELVVYTCNLKLDDNAQPDSYSDSD